MRMYGLYKNNNLKSSLISETREGFEEYLNTTTNQTIITVLNEGMHIEGSLQDATFNNRTYGDEKIFLCRINEVLTIGDYVLWKHKPYLVTAEDINTSPTHRTFILRPCNNLINIKVDDKVMPLYVIIDGAIAKYKETDTIAMHNDELRMICGYCLSSSTLKENMKVNLKDKVYRITTLEDLTGNHFGHKGIINAYIKRELKSASDNETNNPVEDDKTEDNLEDIMDDMFGGGIND